MGSLLAYALHFPKTFAWLLPFAVIGLPAGLAFFTAAAFGAARLLWTRGPLRILALSNDDRPAAGGPVLRTSRAAAGDRCEVAQGEGPAEEAGAGEHQGLPHAPDRRRSPASPAWRTDRRCDAR